MNVEQLCACADVLNCSTDAILGREIRTDFSDPRETELHRVWGQLDRERQDRLVETAQDMEAAKSVGSTRVQAEKSA